MPDLLDRLKTALADRYAIEEELGAGVEVGVVRWGIVGLCYWITPYISIS